MQRLTALFLLAVSMLFSSSVALADFDLIATNNFGVAIPSAEQANISVDGDSGYSIGGSLGLRFGDLIQWDAAEVDYQSAHQGDGLLGLGQYTSSALMVGSGIRVGMFGGGSKLHPYVSFGVGGTRISFEQGGADVINEWGFGWNAGGGLLFDVNDSVSVGGRYRYRSSSFDEVSGVSIQEVTVGIHSVTFEVVFGR